MGAGTYQIIFYLSYAGGGEAVFDYPTEAAFAAAKASLEPELEPGLFIHNGAEDPRVAYYYLEDHHRALFEAFADLAGPARP